MNKKVIAVLGYDKCGKDTTAYIIKNILQAKQKSVTIVRFADVLKKIASDILNISPVILEKMKDDKKMICIGTEYIEARDFIIRVASTLRKHLGNKIFVNPLLEYIKDNDYEYFIIPDLRFIAEDNVLSLLRTNGGIDKYIKIWLDSNLNTCGKNRKIYDLDVLEPSCNIVIKNRDGNMSNLYKEVNKKLLPVLGL